MLIFNPRRVFVLRGIENPQGFLVKNGFNPTTAHNLLNTKTRYAKFEYIEKFCALLNCTPNDLFDWKPDKDTVINETHPLNELRRKETTLNNKELIKDIPIERVAEIENLLIELKNK